MTKIYTVAGVVVAVIIALIALGIAISNGHPSGSLANSTNYTQLGAQQLKVGNGCQDAATYGGCTGSFNSATSSLSTYWTMGGVNYASVQVPMAATSSVPCSMANPFGAATSTLLNYFARASASGIATAQTFDLSTSSTAYASSSPAFVKKFSGTVQFTLPWTPGVSSTTNAGVIGYDSFSSKGNSPYILGPSENLNLNIATGTPGTYASYYTGTCSGTFMQG